MTLQQFLKNAIVRAIATALAAGVIAALVPIVPVLAQGVVPGKDAFIAAAMMGAAGTASVVVSFLTRFVGDPNSGSFTH